MSHLWHRAFEARALPRNRKCTCTTKSDSFAKRSTKILIKTSGCCTPVGKGVERMVLGAFERPLRLLVRHQPYVVAVQLREQLELGQ